MTSQPLLSRRTELCLWILLGLHVAWLFLTLSRFDGLLDARGLPLTGPPRT